MDNERTIAISKRRVLGPMPLFIACRFGVGCMHYRRDEKNGAKAYKEERDRIVGMFYLRRNGVMTEDGLPPVCVLALHFITPHFLL